MKTRQMKLLCLLIEFVGIAALLLPFTSGKSPWREIGGFLPWKFGWFWPLALPASLAPFVCLQTLRSLFPPPLTKLELRLCTGLVGLLALFPLSLFWWEAVQSNGPAEWEKIIRLWLLFGSALVVAGLLLTLKLRGVSAQFLVPIELRGSYIPGAVYGLLIFSEMGTDWNLLEVGAAFVGATVLLYLVEIVHLTRQGLKSRPVAMSSIGSPP